MNGSNGNLPSVASQNGEGRTSGTKEGEQDKLIETLAGWVFLWPDPDDAALAARSSELQLSVNSYQAGMLARSTGQRSFVVVARDTDEGERAAELVAEACRRGKATAALAWRLADYGTKYSDLASWLEHYALDRLIAFEKPWQGRAARATLAENHADVLLRLAKSIALFRTPDGDAYATVPVRGRREHHPVMSDAVADWLLHGFYRELGKAPSAEAMQNAVRILVARARYEETTTQCPVALRVAADPGRPPGDPAYYLDLADEARNAVKLTPLGWDVVTDLPIRFRRPRGVAALPIPQRGGKIDELWDFLNVSSEEDRLLVVASLTGDFLPVGPYPVKVITGEQGSAKSTTTRLLKRLVDPRSPMLGSAPKDVRDLMVIAKSTWVLSFDNLSAIPVWLSDALARLSTGGGFSTRKLHSDDEEMFFEATRPIILNSIEDIANRADLLDRSIVITCPAIPEAARRQEREFWAEFEGAYPRVLGALLDAVCGGLAMLPTVHLAKSPRMADFARWGEAVCRFIGYQEGAFMDAYTGNRDAAAASILEDSPVAACLAEFRHPGDVWRGTAQELLDQVRELAPSQVRESPRWPKSPRSLSAHLRRIAPALRKVGIDVVFPEGRGKVRDFAVVWTEPEPTAGPKTQNFATLATAPTPGPPFEGNTESAQVQPRRNVPY